MKYRSPASKTSRQTKANDRQGSPVVKNGLSIAPPSYGIDIVDRKGHPVIQPKLTVGPADDKYEREADAVSGQVMRQISKPAPQPDVQHETGRGADAQRQGQAGGANVTITPHVQRQSTDAGGYDVSPKMETAIKRSHGGGKALPESTRAAMEGSFAADFSAVRVHTGPPADTLNRSLGARAFTTRSDIFFRQGEYQPDSSAGQNLLAHELTHTIQQAGAGSPGEETGRPGLPIQREITDGQKRYELGSYFQKKLEELEFEKITGKQEKFMKSVLQNSTDESEAKEYIDEYVAKQKLMPLEEADEKIQELLSIYSIKVNRPPLKEESLRIVHKTTFEKAMHNAYNQVREDVLAFVEFGKKNIIWVHGGHGFIDSDLLHEGIHTYRHLGWKKIGGQGTKTDEGATEYFANKIADKYSLPMRKPYEEEVTAVESMVKYVGEKALAEVYFRGKEDGIESNLEEGIEGFNAWVDKVDEGNWMMAVVRIVQAKKGSGKIKTTVSEGRIIGTALSTLAKEGESDGVEIPEWKAATKAVEEMAHDKFKSAMIKKDYIVSAVAAYLLREITASVRSGGIPEQDSAYEAVAALVENTSLQIVAKAFVEGEVGALLKMSRVKAWIEQYAKGSDYDDEAALIWDEDTFDSTDIESLEKEYQQRSG